MIMKSQRIRNTAYRYLDAKNVGKFRVILWGSHYSELNKKHKLLKRN